MSSDDIIGEEATRAVSPTEAYYRENNQAIKTLFLLCFGIKEEINVSQPLLDLDKNPWNGLKASSIKPRASDYKSEIERRCLVFGISSIPRPNAWSLKKTQDWLNDNPITVEEEVAFLRATVTAEKSKMKMALATANMEAELLSGKSWTGKIPYLRLIHCLVDNDEIKRAYLSRNNIPTGRLHIDNRNSVNKRPKTVWEMISDKWNDHNFAPDTKEIMDLHSDFSESEYLSWMCVENLAPATPENARKNLHLWV
jgi:hypothetical protein